MNAKLARRIVAEAVGTAFLLAAVAVQFMLNAIKTFRLELIAPVTG